MFYVAYSGHHEPNDAFVFITAIPLVLVLAYWIAFWVACGWRDGSKAAVRNGRNREPQRTITELTWVLDGRLKQPAIKVPAHPEEKPFSARDRLVRLREFGPRKREALIAGEQ